jgi:glycosyltransferase involved in cell wall biosynthesis
VSPLRGVGILVQDVDALGGSERQARLLSEELTAMGERVLLLTCNGAGPLGRPRGPWRERRRGVDIVRLPTLGFEAAAGPILARAECDVLYAVGVMMGAFAGRLGRLLDAPVVVKLACSGPWGDVAALDALEPGAKARARIDLAEASVVCLSADLVREAEGAGLGRVRLRVPNGVPPPPPGAAMRLCEGPTVLFVGRLDDQKGVDVLLDAWAELPEDVAEAQLLLAGEGPARRALEAQAVRLGIGERVRFLGRRSDVWGLLRGATLCCLPSRSEGLSNALLEALAVGCPLVVSDIPANVEVVGDDAGLVAQVDDPTSLALCLARGLRDSELRSRLAAAGVALIERDYALRVVAERHQELFRSLPRRPRPGLARLGPRYLQARAQSAQRLLSRFLRP